MSANFIQQSPKTLTHFTNPELMVPELQSRTAAAIIGELSGALQRQGCLNDIGGFCDAVMQRELLSATSMSPGWALPHARLRGLTRISFAIGRSSRPLLWLGDQGSRVHTVFLFAVPEMESKTYLNLIASIARLSQNAELVEQLRLAPTAGAMFQILEQVPLRQPRPASAATLPARLEAH